LSIEQNDEGWSEWFENGSVESEATLSLASRSSLLH
jgi:hypothetical protein